MNQEKSGSSFDRWYKDNGEAYNQARRERYRADKAYRQKVLKQSEEYRKKKPAAAKPRVVRTDLAIGEAAQMLGISTQTLRQYEDKKYLPSAKAKSAHRRYTLHQVGLIRELVNFLKESNYHAPKYYQSIKKIAANIRKNWKGN